MSGSWVPKAEHLIEGITKANATGRSEYMFPTASFAFDVGGQTAPPIEIQLANKLTEDLALIRWHEVVHDHRCKGTSLNRDIAINEPGKCCFNLGPAPIEAVSCANASLYSSSYDHR